ncbi:MAG: sugar phosphate isomerase/epimerase [Clostridiaceae bacterium]|nr:sugar phosphate isomerase/epimerase [Clostridiaceae bacterium]
MSCLPVSLFPDIVSGKISIPEWARNAKKMGYNGIDISTMFIKNHTPVYIENLKKSLANEGMPIIMATTYPDFTHPNKTQRYRELEYLRYDIALCSELGIRYLRVLAGQAHPSLDIQTGIDRAIEGLRAAADVASAYDNVTLLYENHARTSAWKYADFSYPPTIFLKVFEGIANTSIGINFDTGNVVAYNEEPLPILKKVFHKVKTVHISDTEAYGIFKPVVIGTGAVPNREIIKYLRKNSFEGWLCVEEASNTGLVGMEKALSFVRSAWDEQ